LVSCLCLPAGYHSTTVWNFDSQLTQDSRLLTQLVSLLYSLGIDCIKNVVSNNLFCAYLLPHTCYWVLTKRWLSSQVMMSQPKRYRWNACVEVVIHPHPKLIIMTTKFGSEGIHSVCVGFYLVGTHEVLVFWRAQHFGNWNCLHSHVKGWGAHSLLGPLERANLSHWTFYASVPAAICAPDIRFCEQENLQ
jgi:hypothetical protein